jgi:hypothetical protein
MQMLKSKLSAVAMIFCTLSYAMASTSAIGTVSARGDMQVDGQAVKGDATLFDGSEVQTGQNSAVLRTSSGVEVRLATDSGGTLYQDRFVLSSGSSELTTTKPFQIVVHGLHVSSVQADSKGSVTLMNRTIEVSALAGELFVRDSHGFLLARVSAGNSAAFGEQQTTDPDEQKDDKDQRPQSPIQSHHLKKKAAWLLLGTGAAALGTGLYIANSGGTPASR